MKIDIKAFSNYAVNYLKEMLSEISAIYKENGIEPFKKPLMFALPGFLISYFLIYQPSVNQLNNYERELKTLQTLAPYYNDYISAKETINSYRNKLPLYKDKDEWLNFIITSSSKKVGVSIDSLLSQNEVELSGFSVVSREVMVTTTYELIGKWLVEIENSPIFLKITNFNLKKIESKVGYASVSLKLSTVFIKPDGT